MSSDDITIQVEDVGKCFEIYKNPQDRLKQLMIAPLQTALGKEGRNYYEPFWALQHISFEVKRGQCVGIIGQNGSGKSTLLQLITGILAPTYGKIETYGRVGALIELGSGFNPEFTGRENVYLNGCLLGLTNEEVERKFDQIAAFADIGEQLDRPVKTYSSGMMLRLAFAVQMAVEPAILIIDEALAVGDARFQLKCFRRLAELKAKGTTILFVSHAVDLIQSFCDIGIVLDGGKLVYSGQAKAATGIFYSILFPEHNQAAEQEETVIFEQPEQITNKPLDYIAIESRNSMDNGTYVLRVNPDQFPCHSFGVGGACLNNLEVHGLSHANVIASGQEIKVRCAFSWDIEIVRKVISEGVKDNIAICIAFADKKGAYIFGCNGFDAGLKIDYLQNNSCSAEFIIKTPALLEGDYFMTVAITVGDLSNHVQLKWYDYLVPLQIVKSQRTVFGLMAVAYKMKYLKNDGSYDEQISALKI